MNKSAKMVGLMLYLTAMLLAARSDTRSWTALPWLRIAEGQLQTREVPGPRSHPRIAMYHATTELQAPDDETPWCSSFVNWCLRQVDLPGTDSARARSWLDWGEELCQPRVGSIVVLQGERPWEGHVGFLLDDRGTEIVILGGNQGDEVSIRAYPAGLVLGYRWPALPALPGASLSARPGRPPGVLR